VSGAPRHLGAQQRRALQLLPQEAWIVDYVDQRGRRHIKTFPKKKAADPTMRAARSALGEC
jgi:hypothetical protein